MTYGSSLISAVYFIDFHIAAIGVDFVWTCEAIALTSIHGGELYGAFIGDTLVIHGDCQ